MTDFTQSEKYIHQSARYLAGGVASSLRAAMKPTPLFAEFGKGPRIRDVDGNEYIDYLLAYGPLILGHAHPVLTARVGEAMAKGCAYGLQHRGEIELARKLTDILPCADRVALSGSGTEAVMLALRLARAYTGKRKVVRFHGHYHGWSDAIFTAFPSPDMRSSMEDDRQGRISPGTQGQSEAALQDVLLLPWNDEQALEDTLRSRCRDIAAVIMEPVMCNSGCIAPRSGYLEKARALTKELGIVFILDEVITGFRLGLGGAQERFGIRPDLATMGKALAGGIALSAVAGSGELMALIESGKVSHLGTLNGNAAATTAALATIEELERNDGEAFKRLEELAGRLAEGIRKLMRKHGIRGVVNQVGPVFHMMFIDRDEVATFGQFSERDAALYSRFAERMLHEGVLLRTNGLWYVSTAHGAEEEELTLAAADRALASLA